MFHYKWQIRRIYAITALSSLQFAGACWVALLAARGFSLTQIGLVETVFHLASFLFEVPSGVIADVFGRKRSMVVSQCMSAVASIAMMLSSTMSGVCIGMALSALGYNFASGSREALAYESLKQGQKESAYDRFAVNDTTIWRMGSAIATLCTGAALWIGPRAAYGVDLTLALLGLWPVLQLQEPKMDGDTEKNPGRRIYAAVQESIDFMMHHPKVLQLMFCNAAIGSVATMLLYLLQARLPEIGVPIGWLGPVLFLLGLSSMLGLQLARFAGRMRYRSLALLCGGGVLIGTYLASSSFLLVVLAGAFLAGTLDDILDVRSDVKLNEMVLSCQRATLVSLSSLVYSLVMLVVAPLLGALFSILSSC